MADRRKDPEYMAELSRKAVAARQKKREQQARKVEAAAPDGEVDPWQVLKEIAGNKKVAPYSRTQAAKALQASPAPETEAEWRSSVQVRPDYEPPSWREVLMVAKASGAF